MNLTPLFDVAAFESYRGQRCLVTGGLGFVGSNMARALVGLGARVTIVDNESPGQGANAYNLRGIESSVELIRSDINDAAAMAEAVRDQAYVFNMAGKSSHTDSLESPLVDMETNVRGQLVLLDAIRRHAPAARVVFASTRSVYGLVQHQPVDEHHPFVPTEVNSADKAAADLYHTAFWHAYGLSTVSLRLTNIYGPRMLLAHSRQGFINWFVRLALEGGTIRLYGDGEQRRDFVYIDDAVQAFLIAGLRREEQGVAFNIGSGTSVSLRQIAETLIDITGRGSITYVPFPEAEKRIEIGDYVADTHRTEKRLNWRATTSLRPGLEATCAYYETCFGEYAG
ncbi:MAG TPA: NAD-dependent epimerase/dehydratase family protein [Dehalococcoidia bacterium]|nr:NAD-dependent epimerase/dehydratase family protein [Dehalococcoidia bacterium]